MRTKPHKESKSSLRRWGRYLELVSEAGAIAMSLRDKPKALDWVAVGIRALGLVSKIHAQHREMISHDPWSFFDDEGFSASWVEVPNEFRKMITDHVTDPEVVDTHWDGHPDSSRVVVGKIGTEQVGWIASSQDELIGGPYIRAGREFATYAQVGESMWSKIGSNSIVFGHQGIQQEYVIDDNSIMSEKFELLESRLRQFLSNDINRSVLLLGPPGTGKSTGIRQIVQNLGLTSLRVELDAFLRDHRSSTETTDGLDTLLQVLNPGVLIIDDIDRIGNEPKLLSFLEDAARRCKLVLASANCTDKMFGAALRPGRFDEVVYIRHLDPKVLKTLLAPNLELVERMQTWPVAYVSEFVKRRAALGIDAAMKEIPDLETRLKKVEAMESEED